MDTVTPTRKSPSIAFLTTVTVSELELWDKRAQVLAAGGKWEESHCFIHNGESRFTTAEEALAKVASGEWKRCQEGCSSPCQVIYHGVDTETGWGTFSFDLTYELPTTPQAG